VEYLPAEQYVQAASPADVLYLPAAHWEHGLPSTPVKPALQMHFCIVVLPSGEAEFAGHAVHLSAALTPLSRDHVLAPHFVQEPAPPKEYLPSPQDSQTCAPVAPVYSEYLPAAQLLQVDFLSTTSEYFPRSQFLQDACFTSS
jgi:hypothetical protein